MYANGTTTGPELMYNGAPVVAGQFSGWAPIGAEVTSNGYEVAWSLASSNQYTVWNTDNNGNYTSDAIGIVAATSPALEALEPSFHQDLNGDGVIGSVIESFGSNSLVQVGSNYFMYANGTTTGPELMYNGAPVVAGQFSGWAPIGAEVTSSGYEVAWSLASSNQYTVWNTDNGNYTSDTIGIVAATSPALEALEPSFHQDLNGDGVIGVPTSLPASWPASARSLGAAATSVSPLSNLVSELQGAMSVVDLAGADDDSGQIVSPSAAGTAIDTTTGELATSAAQSLTVTDPQNIAHGSQVHDGNGARLLSIGTNEEDVVAPAPGEPFLQFSPALLANFAAAMGDAKQVGANTVITVNPNDTMTLQNVTLASLTSSKFHFG
jgi:hypothetical protein